MRFLPGAWLRFFWRFLLLSYPAGWYTHSHTHIDTHREKTPKEIERERERDGRLALFDKCEKSLTIRKSSERLTYWHWTGKSGARVLPLRHSTDAYLNRRPYLAMNGTRNRQSVGVDTFDLNNPVRNRQQEIFPAWPKKKHPEPKTCDLVFFFRSSDVDLLVTRPHDHYRRFFTSEIVMACVCVCVCACLLSEAYPHRTGSSSQPVRGPACLCGIAQARSSTSGLSLRCCCCCCCCCYHHTDSSTYSWTHTHTRIHAHL